MAKQNLNPINPREGGRPKNSLNGLEHAPIALTPHVASTDSQLRGATTGGKGHATRADVPGVNPLATPTRYTKAVALQTENVPNTVGSRNRNGE
jgi:hypothetical protein